MSSYFFLKNRLNGFVMDIKDADPAPRTPVVSARQKREDRLTQLWELPIGDPKTEFHFIRNCLHHFVVDLEEFRTGPDSRVVVFPQKCDGDFRNQLWDLQPAGSGGRFYFIRSRVDPNQVLEIENAERNRSAPIVLRRKGSGNPAQQLWELVPCETDER